MTLLSLDLIVRLQEEHKQLCAAPEEIPIVNPFRMVARRGIALGSDKILKTLFYRLCKVPNSIFSMILLLAAFESGIMGSRPKRNGNQYRITFWFDLGSIENRLEVPDDEISEGELCLRLSKVFLVNRDTKRDQAMIDSQQYQDGPEVVNIVLRRYPEDGNLNDRLGEAVFLQKNFQAPKIMVKFHLAAKDPTVQSDPNGSLIK